MLVTDLRILLVDTARVWWRLLPQILPLYLLGWLGSELTLRIAVIAGDLTAWLTLVLFAFNFVFVLVAAVLTLRTAGRELGIRELLPEDEREHDERDRGVSHLLLITLLPFLGMYAAFGQVSDAANRLQTEQLVRYGVFDSGDTILGVLRNAADHHLVGLIALILGTYALRRVIDHVQERSGWRLLGLVAVLVESFFMLTLILGGVRVFQTFLLWLQNRRVAQWLASLEHHLAAGLAVFKIDLPAVLTAGWSFLSEQVWPVFTDVLTQPLLWLAVAALIYGSRVLTLADLWRRGQPYAAQVPGASAFLRYRERRASRATLEAPRSLQVVATKFQETFFGDVNDKYLPAFHSLRLILRAGLTFLGAYVLVYSVVIIAQNYVTSGLHRLLGGHTVTFWVTYGPVIDVIDTAPFETLRLCLLAVAFRRCLEVFRQRTLDDDTPALIEPAGSTVTAPA